MTSSLFGKPSGNSLIQAINQVRALGSPQSAFNSMYQSNPQFRQFADSMRGKTPEQAFRENGLDFGQVRRFMK